MIALASAFRSETLACAPCDEQDRKCKRAKISVNFTSNDEENCIQPENQSLLHVNYRTEHIREIDYESLVLYLVLSDDVDAALLSSFNPAW